MSDRHVYRFALFGQQDGGKTSWLSSLCTTREPDDKRDRVAHVTDEKVWHEIVKRLRFPTSALDSLALGRDHISAQLVKLKQGNAPASGEPLTSENFALPSVLMTGIAAKPARGPRPEFIFTVFDYDGVSLTRSLFQDPAADPGIDQSADESAFALRQQFVDCDGLVMLVPAATTTSAAPHLADLTASFSAFWGARQQSMPARLGPTASIPIAIALTKADGVLADIPADSDPEGISSALSKWLGSDPHAELVNSLITHVAELAGPENVKVFAVSALGKSEICEVVYEDDRLNNGPTGQRAKRRRFERYYRNDAAVEASAPHRMVYVDTSGRSRAVQAFDAARHALTLDDGTVVKFEETDRGKESHWEDARIRVETTNSGLRLASFGVDEPFAWLAAQRDKIAVQGATDALATIRVSSLHRAYGARRRRAENATILSARQIAGSLQPKGSSQTLINSAISSARWRKRSRNVLAGCLAMVVGGAGALSLDHAALEAQLALSARSMSTAIGEGTTVRARESDVGRLERIAQSPPWRYAVSKYVLLPDPLIQARLDTAKALVTEEAYVSVLGELKQKTSQVNMAATSGTLLSDQDAAKLLRDLTSHPNTDMLLAKKHAGRFEALRTDLSNINVMIRQNIEMGQLRKTLAADPKMIRSQVCNAYDLLIQQRALLEKAPRATIVEAEQLILDAAIAAATNIAEDTRQLNFAPIAERSEDLRAGKFGSCLSTQLQTRLTLPLQRIIEKLNEDYRSAQSASGKHCDALASLRERQKDIEPNAFQEQVRAANDRAAREIQKLVEQGQNYLANIGDRQKAQVARDSVVGIASALNGSGLNCFSRDGLHDSVANVRLKAIEDTLTQAANGFYAEYKRQYALYAENPASMLTIEPRLHLSELADAFVQFAEVEPSNRSRIVEVKTSVQCARRDAPASVRISNVRYSGYYYPVNRSPALWLVWPDVSQETPIARLSLDDNGSEITNSASVSPKETYQWGVERPTSIQLRANAINPAFARDLPAIPTTPGRLAEIFSGSKVRGDDLVISKAMKLNWHTRPVFNNLTFETVVDVELRLVGCLKRQ